MSPSETLQRRRANPDSEIGTHAEARLVSVVVSLRALILRTATRYACDRWPSGVSDGSSRGAPHHQHRERQPRIGR